MAGSGDARGWVVCTVVFALGLALRAGVPELPHDEGDELVYAALVDQLDTGRGYTLQQHTILEQGWLPRSQYDRPLFFHPPAGIALFWVFQRAFGAAGADLAQAACFALFYWSLLALARMCVDGWTLPAALAASAAAGFDPIVTHVQLHHWLDGPQLAFASTGASLFVHSVRRDSRPLAVAAAAALTIACLVKLNAMLMLPLLPPLALAVAGRESRAATLRSSLVLLVLVPLAVSPWLWVQWREYGELFPSWAGRPASNLVRANPFVNFVTEVRGPWSYLHLLPQCVWTLVPSLLMLGALRGSPRARRIGAVLALWMAGVVLVHVALGAIGYSKLLRYVILIVPAAGLLFAVSVAATAQALGEATRGSRHARPSGRVLPALLLALAAGGALLELTHSWQVAHLYPDRALIRPLFGELR